MYGWAPPPLAAALRLVADCSDDLFKHADEFVESRARNNHMIPAAVRFFGDPEETASLVFAVIDKEMLPLDVNFS